MKSMRGSPWRGLALAGSVATALVVAACGGGGGGGAGEGTLRVALTDAPSCYEHVYVTVEKVRVHTSSSASDSDSGWEEVILATPRRVDLLSLTNGVLEELGSKKLPAGSYSQVRLVLAENTGSNPLANAVQPIGGSLVALRTPSAQQSGLKLQFHFDVVADRTVDLLLDFDACKSVVVAGNSGNYNLKPVMTVTPLYDTAIQGYVTTTLAVSATTVTAQKDGVVVRSTTPDSSGKFNLAYLPAGTYTVVITSDGRATGAVTSIPITTSTAVTSINGTATAIVLPSSPMATVTGTVTAGSSLVTDATVRALQDLTGGPVIEVASKAVDADFATYTMRLPQAAPLRAPYSTSGLSWSTDSAVAGKYRIQANAPGRTPVTQSTDISGGSQTVNLGF